MKKIAAVIMFALVVVVASAHALTITLTDGSLILAPLPSDTTVSIYEAKSGVHGVTIGDFTLESPQLDPIPIADYLCPAGQRCHVGPLGLAVLVVGSVTIMPDTGSLTLSSADPLTATTVPEPATWLLMLAALKACMLLVGVKRQLEGRR